ncbi:hypothetical protein LZL87_014207 [Fusarium oxysporum]|nr:hypothetical protein LZL87_014207 [Fusarium oxysporum]
MHFSIPYNTISHRTQLTLSSSVISKFIFGLIKTKPEHISFRNTLSNTPMEREQLSIEHKYMVDMNMTPHGSMGSFTPSTSFGIYGYSPDAFIDAASFMEPKIQSSRKRSIKSNSGRADVVRGAICKCDYSGCHKGFRRNEHLRLTTMKDLTVFLASSADGVEYIPTAVPVIEQEERSRKRRARSKPQTH